MKERPIVLPCRGSPLWLPAWPATGPVGGLRLGEARDSRASEAGAPCCNPEGRRPPLALFWYPIPRHLPRPRPPARHEPPRPGAADSVQSIKNVQEMVK